MVNNVASDYTEMLLEGKFFFRNQPVLLHPVPGQYGSHPAGQTRSFLDLHSETRRSNTALKSYTDTKICFPLSKVLLKCISVRQKTEKHRSTIQLIYQMSQILGFTFSLYMLR